MIRKAFVTHVRPEAHEEYHRRHDALWPELAAVLSEHGFRSPTIHLDRFFKSYRPNKQRSRLVANPGPVCFATR
jgi:L-rhamnose mutarotase